MTLLAQPIPRKSLPRLFAFLVTLSMATHPLAPSFVECGMGSGPSRTSAEARLSEQAIPPRLIGAFRQFGDDLAAQLAWQGAQLQGNGWLALASSQKRDDAFHARLLAMANANPSGSGGEEEPLEPTRAPVLREDNASIRKHLASRMAAYAEIFPLYGPVQTWPTDGESYVQIGHGPLEPSGHLPMAVAANDYTEDKFINVPVREAAIVHVKDDYSPQLVATDFDTGIPLVVRGYDKQGYLKVMLFNFWAEEFMPNQRASIAIDWMLDAIEGWTDVQMALMPRRDQAKYIETDAFQILLRLNGLSVIERPADAEASVIVTPQGFGLFVHRRLLQKSLLRDPERLIADPNFHAFSWKDLGTGRLVLPFDEAPLDVSKMVVVFPPAGEKTEGLDQFFDQYPLAREIRATINKVVKNVLGVNRFDLLQEKTDDAVVNSVQRHALHLAHQIALWKIFEKEFSFPAGFIGISRGAGAAYVAAGAMTIAQAAEWAAYNARFNQLASDRLNRRRMAVVRGPDLNGLQSILDQHTGFVCIQFSNKLFTVSYPESEFDALEAKFRAIRGIFKPLPLQHASHDAYFQSLDIWTEYQKYLHELQARMLDPFAPVYSQLGGHRLHTKADIIAEQIQQAVDMLRWPEAMSKILGLGFPHFLQLGSVKAAALEQQAKEGLLPGADIRAAFDPEGLGRVISYDEQRRALQRNPFHGLLGLGKPPWDRGDTDSWGPPQGMWGAAVALSAGGPYTLPAWTLAMIVAAYAAQAYFHSSAVRRHLSRIRAAA